MSVAINSPKVTARDRLAFTLFMSFALNALVIFGIGFDFEDILNNDDALPTLEVVIVERTNAEEVEDAD